MEQKNLQTINLSDKDYKDVISFCKLNDIDPNGFIHQCFKKGYYVEKYGLLSDDKIIEKEVIKEVIREVPVEVIVEVIKEIPVEVEKEVVVTNTENAGKLQDTIIKLSKANREKDGKILNLEERIKELEEMKLPLKGQILRSSNLNDIGR